MIRLETQNGKIELISYSENALLGELIREVENHRTSSRLGKECEFCGKCCYDEVPLTGADLAAFGESLYQIPSVPSAQSREDGISRLISEHKLDRKTAALLFEYNTGEAVTPKRQTGGGCIHLLGSRCRIYEKRPMACRFYNCIMGENLKILYENIIRQGIWHSYYVLGKIPAASIAGNPFLSGKPERIPLRLFDSDISGALESLFSYF
ncbi:MAG: YkgJ family cysteine cluster protein [Spirochaetia bacterium]